MFKKLTTQRYYPSCDSRIGTMRQYEGVFTTKEEIQVVSKQ